MICLKLIVCSQLEELSKKKRNLFLLSKYHCCARQLARFFSHIISYKIYKNPMIYYIYALSIVRLKDERIKTNSANVNSQAKWQKQD